MQQYIQRSTTTCTNIIRAVRSGRRASGRDQVHLRIDNQAAWIVITPPSPLYTSNFHFSNDPVEYSMQLMQPMHPQECLYAQVIQCRVAYCHKRICASDRTTALEDLVALQTPSHALATPSRLGEDKAFVQPAGSGLECSLNSFDCCISRRYGSCIPCDESLSGFVTLCIKLQDNGLEWRIVAFACQQQFNRLSRANC
jgi:hypothetical protein